MFTKVFTTLLAISASALAYTTPTTFNDTSNPIKTPGSSSIVPVGQTFDITWDPTEAGTVTILLLRGPSSNILPLYPIVEQIPNSGSYKWTPKADLEPDSTHYGIQIIIDANGQYQYSTQFGVSNPNYKPPTSSSAVSSSAAATTSAAPTTTDSYGPEETTTSYETVYTTTKSSVTSFITVTTSSVPYEEPSTTSTYVAPTVTYVPPSSNGTTSYVPTGTGKPTISSVLPPVPSQTGAASSVKVASGLLMGVAGVAAMLL
ncbi:hypothetical protein TWF106_010552 [Orbilia oligospora]|uniref:Yeast cell wall synthesis Kre9/Knh1-like N-terminal domain-containing protein n=1 Tax=Orbilia oligospora TaxID=2813651 RepID=A0A7C8KHI9_ORBOL|nr:hypothetical protein TWF788_001505 [Orbilia oligospora]KAF3214147.1 hypothetical protein TWF679_005013 [Orbilia oligospora]KAF3227064.1 hypothetical protein TWF106_010552 [Orbilia oligospora]